jgi:hypothetical protein
LLKYVKNGGNLLLVGPGSAALFESELGVTRDGQAVTALRFLEHAGAFVPTKGRVQHITPSSKAAPFGVVRVAGDTASASQPAATITPLGKGRIGATWFSYSEGYLNGRNAAQRQFLSALASKLFPKPLVEVQGSADVDVVVNRIAGQLAINLVNTSGPHVTDPIIDSIPAVGPLELTVRQSSKPSRITLEPSGQPLEYQFRSGEIRLTVPKVAIHEIVVVK